MVCVRLHREEIDEIIGQQETKKGDDEANRLSLGRTRPRLAFRRMACWESPEMLSITVLFGYPTLFPLQNQVG